MASISIAFRRLKPDEDYSSLCDELDKFLSEKSSEFEYYLTKDLSHIDQRAENYNGISIEQVSHHIDNEYILDYTYEYHVYNGCSDMDLNGEKSESISFTVQRNGVIELKIPDISNLRGNRIYED